MNKENDVWIANEWPGSHKGYDGRGRWRIDRGRVGEIYWFRSEETANAIADVLNEMGDECSHEYPPPEIRECKHCGREEE